MLVNVDRAAVSKRYPVHVYSHAALKMFSYAASSPFDVVAPGFAPAAADAALSAVRRVSALNFDSESSAPSAASSASRRACSRTAAFAAASSAVAALMEP